MLSVKLSQAIMSSFVHKTLNLASQGAATHRRHSKTHTEHTFQSYAGKSHLSAFAFQKAQLIRCLVTMEESHEF